MRCSTWSNAERHLEAALHGALPATADPLRDYNSSARASSPQGLDTPAGTDRETARALGELDARDATDGRAALSQSRI